MLKGIGQLGGFTPNSVPVNCTTAWMRLKSPAVSMAFFKVAAGNPVITVPLPTRAGNGVPSAKTVPGADTKICHLTEPEFNTPYKRAQMRASFSFNHACSVVLNCTSKQKKLLFLLRTSKKIKIAEFKHTRFHNGFWFDDACRVHCCCFFLRASRKSRFYQNKQIEPSSLILFFTNGVSGGGSGLEIPHCVGNGYPLPSSGLLRNPCWWWLQWRRKHTAAAVGCHSNKERSSERWKLGTRDPLPCKEGTAARKEPEQVQTLVKETGKALVQWWVQK